MNDGPGREPAEGRSVIRLFVRAALGAGAPVALAPAQAHYLRKVMRQAPGDRVRLFNGRDGEWEGTIETLAPKRAGIRIEGLRAAQPPAPDLRLLFAPLKAERTRFTVEKATELGVGALHPVLTRRGQDPARQYRAASRPCDRGGRAVRPAGRAADRPPLPPRRRTRRLAARTPAAGVRSRGRRSIAEALSAAGGRTPWAILIGPRAASHPRRGACLPHHTAAVPARLGPRILRAETAAAAALACLQALAGDWR